MSGVKKCGVGLGWELAGEGGPDSCVVLQGPVAEVWLFGQVPAGHIWDLSHFAICEGGNVYQSLLRETLGGLHNISKALSDEIDNCK